MAYLTFNNTTDSIVRDFTTQIKKGESIALLGPLGCGNSNLLRMVAGIKSVNTGHITLDSQIINGLEPMERDIGMVFKQPNLYAHMSVYDNVAYSLKRRKYSKNTIEHYVNSTAELLEITHLLNRRTDTLSNWQAQMVAIGRAIARRPKVLLFDQSLSVLGHADKTLMYSTLQRLRKALQITSLYATHDYIEAITVADRIIVMNSGVIEQVGTPVELIEAPASTFVASFMGAPAMNLLSVQIDEHGMVYNNENKTIPMPPSMVPHSLFGEKAIMGFHSKQTLLHGESLIIDITLIKKLGAEQLIYGRYGDQIIVVQAPSESISSNPLSLGDTIGIGITTPLHWFNTQTRQRISL